MDGRRDALVPSPLVTLLLQWTHNVSLLRSISRTTDSTSCTCASARTAGGRIVASGIHRTRVSEMRSSASRPAVRRTVIPGTDRRDVHTHSERHGESPGSLTAG